MRTIKFRSWDSFNKRMSFFTMNDLCNHLPDNPEKPSALDVWMQFTCLLDKNGKEIYEGDIVTNGGVRAEVIYTLGSTGFELRTKKGQFIGSPTGWENIEIIGNIYENPDLIHSLK